uniref:Ciliary neurotrophic factor n=1 Tax=Poecilia mexicana TaxID=48701 RepID=A0A3B3Y870_9TELE
MLLGNHWSLVLSTTTEHRCSFESNADLRCSSQNIVALTNLLILETNEALREYVSTSNNDSCSPHIPDEVPTTTVAGFNMIEKLQDIYAKNELFSLHLSQVERYQKDLFTTKSRMLWNLKFILNSLSNLKMRLDYLLKTVECLIKAMDPSTPVPTSPAALNLPYQNCYEKKVYGCAVLVRLRGWGQKVKEVKYWQKSLLSLLCRNKSTRNRTMSQTSSSATN